MIMDSLAALALATELPTDKLLDRKPQNRSDYIVSRKMCKHILLQALWQCLCLFIFLFAGEYIIPETDEKHAYVGVNDGFVFPGRATALDGSELYGRKKQEEVGGPSRHLTFIFTMFVFLQIFNMLAARKIHDEINIFEGMLKSYVFIVIWVVIVVAQILITQFGGHVFVVCLDGLTGTQWLICILVGATSLIINILIKLIPDSAPFVP